MRYPASASGIVAPKHDIEPTADSLVLRDDIGYFIKAGMSSDEVSSCVSAMSAAQKYRLLKQHYTPTNDTVFSYNQDGGCN